MRNKELQTELTVLCKNYGYMEVKDNLKSLGLREFELENHQTIGEKLSNIIDDIVFEKDEYRKWEKRFILNEYNDDFEIGVFDEDIFKKSIKKNQMKVLEVIMS